MGINFSVDRPKNTKRENGMGEDAPAVSKSGVLIVCDGTGATGQSKHPYNGAEYTSAYLGSRKTSELVEAFVDSNYDKFMDSINSPEELKALVSELGNNLREGLCSFVKENDFKLTVRGRSFRLLPTTLAAAIYKIYDDHIDIIALSAGDSRILFWEPENGLHQLSVDDIDGNYDAFSDISNTSNCVSADNDFTINYVVHTIQNPKGVLFATSDGFTDPVKPFDQERYIIQWLGNCDCILDVENSKLAEYIGESLDKVGFSLRDDCSIAGVVLGYASDAELKAPLKERFEYVTNNFAAPFVDLNKKCKEALDAFTNAEGECRKYIEQTHAKIKDSLIQNVSVILPGNSAKNELIYHFLTTQAFINAEINKIADENQRQQAKAQEQLKPLDKELFDSYIELLKYCFVVDKDADIDLPADVISHLGNYATLKPTRDNLYKAFNDTLHKIQGISDISPDGAAPHTVDILSLADALNKTATELDRVNNSFVASEKAINNFFAPDNARIQKLFEYHKGKNFEDLDEYIDDLKPAKKRLDFFSKPKKEDPDYLELKKRKDAFDEIYNKYQAAKDAVVSAKLSDSEILQRYRTVVNNNFAQLLTTIKNDSNVFSVFAGIEKEVFDTNIASTTQAEKTAKDLIEQKNNLWKSYKTGYEMFATAEKGSVVVPKRSEE